MHAPEVFIPLLLYSHTFEWHTCTYQLHKFFVGLSVLYSHTFEWHTCTYQLHNFFVGLLRVHGFIRARLYSFIMFTYYDYRMNDVG